MPKKEYYQFYNRQSVFECARCDAIVVTSPLLLKSRLANLILLAVPFFYSCFALFTTAVVVVVVHRIHGAKNAKSTTHTQLNAIEYGQ